MRWLVRAALVVVLAGVSVAAYLMLSGPRMKVQPHIRAYDRPMPMPPEGSVPLEEPYAPAPSAAEAKGLDNPLQATPQNLNKGRTYYGYYCAFCHGKDGAGTGPVGESYVPTPADLRSARVQSLSDGQLLRAALTGTGHDGILQRVIPCEHRWPLVLYVRELASGDGPTAARGP